MNNDDKTSVAIGCIGCSAVLGSLAVTVGIFLGALFIIKAIFF